MQLLKNYSIRQRLMYIIMAISFISVVLTTLAISVIGVYGMRDNILHGLSESAAIVGASNKAALSFDAYKKPTEALGVFSEYKIIIRACLYDHEAITGRIIDKAIASYPLDTEDEIKKCPEEFLTERTVISEDRVRMMKPIIENEGNIIGYIYLESTLEQIDQYIRKQTTIALSVALAALIVSYLLAISLQKTISKPILSLADTARQVTAHKDYSIRAASLGDTKEEFNNELVILTNAFNNMLTEIGERDTRLKAQYVEIEKAKDAAESANRAKSQFLANISHELRTPLNAIIGFSSILMNQLFGPLGDQKYLEYSKDINESGAHLLDIINDILDLSKAEAGKLTINFEEVHVGKSINKCVTILGERAAKGAVSLTVDVPKTLPPLVADRLRFIQILLNIMSNAIKFTGEGGKVHIGVRTREEAGEVSHFIISIRDSGIGMARADIDKAFQSFGQIDSGLNRKYEGTGLGLPLTKKLMDLHYGTIDIESDQGKGTLVTLVFPALPPAEAGYTAE